MFFHPVDQDPDAGRHQPRVGEDYVNGQRRLLEFRQHDLQPFLGDEGFDLIREKLAEAESFGAGLDRRGGVIAGKGSGHRNR